MKYDCSDEFDLSAIFAKLTAPVSREAREAARSDNALYELTCALDRVMENGTISF